MRIDCLQLAPTLCPSAQHTEKKSTSAMPSAARPQCPAGRAWRAMGSSSESAPTSFLPRDLLRPPDGRSSSTAPSSPTTTSNLESIVRRHTSEAYELVARHDAPLGLSLPGHLAHPLELAEALPRLARPARHGGVKGAVGTDAEGLDDLVELVACGCGERATRKGEGCEKAEHREEAKLERISTWAERLWHEPQEGRGTSALGKESHGTSRAVEVRCGAAAGKSRDAPLATGASACDRCPAGGKPCGDK